MHEICWVNYQENHYNYWHQMSHFRDKMHQIRFLVSARFSVCVLDGVWHSLQVGVCVKTREATDFRRDREGTSERGEWSNSSIFDRRTGPGRRRPCLSPRQPPPTSYPDDSDRDDADCDPDPATWTANSPKSSSTPSGDDRSKVP